MRKGEDNRKWILKKYQVQDKLEDFVLLDSVEEEVERLEFEEKVSLINSQFDNKGGTVGSKDIRGVAEEWIPGSK